MMSSSRLLLLRTLATKAPKTPAAVDKIKEGAGELGQIGYKKAQAIGKEVSKKAAELVKDGSQKVKEGSKKVYEAAKEGQKKAGQLGEEAIDSARKKVEEPKKSGVVKDARRWLGDKVAGRK